MPVINGTAQGEFLGGGVDAETINALEGNDRVWGRGGDDVINGGDGDDILIGERGFDVPDGWDETTVGNDTINGGAGNDIVIGGLGNDILNGGDGNDRLLNGIGTSEDLTQLIFFSQAHATRNDTIDGGPGDDHAYLNYADRTAPIVFSLSNSTALASVVVGGVAQGSVIGVEGIDFYGGSASDQIFATGAASAWLEGRDGDDVIVAGTGADFLLGGAGADSLSGGDGDDQIEGGSGRGHAAGRRWHRSIELHPLRGRG